MICEHEFVAPITGPGLRDEWPTELWREVVMRVSHMHLGCEVCAQGDLLATLPDIVAQSYSGGGVLRRLPVEMTAPTRLYATHRPSLGVPSRADVIVAALRQRFR